MSASWPEQKTNFLSRKTQIDALWGQLENKKTSIKNVLEKAIRKGGSLSNIEKDELQKSFRSMFEASRNYESLLGDINAFINRNMLAPSKSDATVIAGLQDDIKVLKEKIAIAKADYETAVSRRESVEEPRKHLSNYQGFSGLIAFDRPLKKHSIAILLGFGVFLILIGSLMLRDVIQTSPASLNTGFVMTGNSASSDFFTPANIVNIMGGMIFFFAIIGIFAYKGFIGKRL